MGQAGTGEEGLDFSYLFMGPTHEGNVNMEGEAKGVKISEHSDVSFK